MFASQMFKVFRSRVPWAVMKVLLRVCELPISGGWESTRKNITQGDNGIIRDEFIEKINLLEKRYFDYLLVGEKSVQLYQVKREEIDNAISYLKTLEIPTNIFHETYPYSLDLEKLDSANSNPELVEIRESETSLFLVFCTKRLFTERRKINTEDLSEEAQDGLKVFDEIIGIRNCPRQFFDVVVLSKITDLVEVRIDISHGITDKDRLRAFLSTVSAFNDLSRGKNGKKIIIESINIFSLIDGLYQSQEGKVFELSFLTDEGSVKSEKFRKFDLRDELYHKAGKEAVHHINPFRLGISWKFPILEGLESQPEMILPGHSRSLSTLSQRLDEVIISKCSGLNDYDFVFSKIITYLNEL